MFFYGWEGTECISLKIRDWSTTLQIHVKKTDVISWASSEKLLLVTVSGQGHQRGVSVLFSLWNGRFQCLTGFQVFGPIILIKPINVLFFLKLQISLHMWRSGGRVGPFGTIGPRSHGDILFMGQFGSSESRLPLPLHYFRYLCFKKIVFAVTSFGIGFSHYLNFG